MPDATGQTSNDAGPVQLGSYLSLPPALYGGASASANAYNPPPVNFVGLGGAGGGEPIQYPTVLDYLDPAAYWGANGAGIGYKRTSYFGIGGATHVDVPVTLGAILPGLSGIGQFPLYGDAYPTNNIAATVPHTTLDRRAGGVRKARRKVTLGKYL